MKRIIISTDSVNNYGYRLLSKGCDLSLYNNNSILLFMHQRGVIIGKLKDIKVEKGQMTAEPVFADTPKGNECKYLYENDMLNMASVWAEPTEWNEDEKLKLKGQTLPTVTKWILKEVSLVDVAGNKETIKLVDANGDEFKLSDFNTQTNFKQKTDMKKLALFLKLSDAASEEAILEAVQRIHTEHADLTKKLADKTAEADTLATAKIELEKKLAEQGKAEFKTLLDAPERKLTAEQKTTYNKLFDTDSKLAMEVVKGLPTHGKLADIPTGNELKDDTHKDWTLADFMKNDPEAVEQMKLKDKPRYIKLFKAQYGSEPTNIVE